MSSYTTESYLLILDIYVSHKIFISKPAIVGVVVRYFPAIKRLDVLSSCSGDWCFAKSKIMHEMDVDTVTDMIC